MSLDFGDVIGDVVGFRGCNGECRWIRRCHWECRKISGMQLGMSLDFGDAIGDVVGFRVREGDRVRGKGVSRTCDGQLHLIRRI